MLKGTDTSVLKSGAMISLQHHEKWDGSGYPHGLKGENIHIYGRITAISDVFDALGSDRCYKKAWELDKILELFKEEKGKHFDPTLVDIFFEELDNFLAIRDKLKDTIKEG
jgi:response regulator RpfG family c-di-GMP phosphodiesterase